MRYASRSLSAVSIVVLLAACAPAAQEPAATEEQGLTDQERQVIEEMLFQYENDWMEVNLSKDRAALDRILADDLVYTLDTGEVVGKEGIIDLFLNNPVTYTAVDLPDLEAHWYADNVVLIVGGDTTTGTDAEGNSVATAGRFTNVFVERDGEWQCVVGHYTYTQE